MEARWGDKGQAEKQPERLSERTRKGSDSLNCMYKVKMQSRNSKKLVGHDNSRSNKFVRVGTADALEIRFGYYGVTQDAVNKLSKIGECCDANTEQTVDHNWLMAA